MVKAKPKATVMVADGAGGLVPVEDQRFKADKWPIQFEVPKEMADMWLPYFHAECQRRGWSSGGIGQLEARENSGSITVNASIADKPQLDVVWERRRGGPIKVSSRAKSADAEVEEFFKQVNDRCRSGATECFYRRGQLQYNGLAWRGELWLDDTVRLGPPTRQDETAANGQRIILVDMQIDCAGRSDLPYAFDQRLRELAVFLSVVTGTLVQLPEPGRVWTHLSGVGDCEVRCLGYWEPESPQEMPTRGTCRDMPLMPVTRPDFSLRGNDGSTNEKLLPADVHDLWMKYGRLTANQRRQFLQVGNKWQEALSHWGRERTLSFALMVVACEALKPADPQFNNHNIYEVVEALLGKEVLERLRRLQQQGLCAQNVRSTHLHLGEFYGSEFIRDMVMSSYEDPTFGVAHRELAEITQAAIIEWLRRCGDFTLPPFERKKNWRRWVKEHVLMALSFAVSLGIAAGLMLGWIAWAKR